MAQLTSAQLEQLRNAGDAGNFIEYYTLLSQFGDPYGTLAWQVVMNEPGAGAAARAFAQTYSADPLDWQ